MKQSERQAPAAHTMFVPQGEPSATLVHATVVFAGAIRLFTKAGTS